MPERRLAQVQELLRRGIDGYLSRFYEPPVGSVLTIEEIIVSRDFGHAKILISVLPDSHREQVIHDLGALRGEIRTELSHTLRLRRVPELHFHVDDREERAERIERLLKEP